MISGLSYEQGLILTLNLGKEGFMFFLLWFIAPSIFITNNSLEYQRGYSQYLAQNHIYQRRRKRASQKSLKPQYQNCQGKNIYQLDSNMRAKPLSFETEAKGPCIDCALQEQNQNLSSLSHTISEDRQKHRTQNQKHPQKPDHIFKEKLKKRVIGLIQSKIAETERLKACVKGDRSWFAKKAPKVDWPLMKAVCQKDKQALSQSIKKGWKDMRVNLALVSVNPDQIVTGKPNLSFPLKHEVSSFGSIKKLTQKEQEQAKKTWANYLTTTTLKTLTPSQLKTAFLKGDGQFLGKTLSTNDLKTLRRNTRKMQKESQARYRQVLEEMPLLAYLETGDPNNQKDMDQAFSKIQKELTDSLEKIKNKDVDMGVLLAFKPLVEGLLKESKGGYCLIAERARESSKKEESLKKAGLLALGVLSAVPCFMAGPVGAVACLGAGLGAGGVAYALAKGQAKDSLGRALTGQEYERMADLAKRDKEKFWELILLPTAGFGTTAGAIKATKELTKKTLGKKTQTAPAPTKALWSAKPHINPEEMRIKKIESDTKSPTETFHIQWTSSNNKEREFQLEIPKESLEKNKADIEQFIKGVVEDEELTAKEAEEFASYYRKKGDLLFNVQKYISQMSEESFEGIDKISLQDLESMLITQYKNSVFEHFVQNYNKAGPSKLSHIGTENVHIQKTGEDRYWTEYDVQFKTQKGKQMSLKLNISNESLVHAFMKATKSTKTNMNLAKARLDDIPFSSEKDLTSVLAHELGHVVQHTEYSLTNLSVLKNVDFKDMRKAIDKTRNPKGWSSAIQKDGSSVSEYGDSSEAEDFAEAMRVYIQTDGGAKDPEALNKYANRFEILDSLMKTSMKDRQNIFSKFKKALEKKGVVFVTGAGALTHVVLQDHVYMLPPPQEPAEPPLTNIKQM